MAESEGRNVLVTGAMIVAGGGGWLYWLFLCFQFKSVMGAIFAFLGPFGALCGVLGLWSFLFGVPEWLFHWFT